jgi:hypothetical protein
MLRKANAGHHLPAESRWRKTFGELSDSLVAGQVNGRVREWQHCREQVGAGSLL